MTFLLSLFPKAKIYLALFGAVAVALIVGFFKGNSFGSTRKAAEQAKKDIKAVNERLAMRREGDTAEREAKALDDEEARQEAMRWSGD